MKILIKYIALLSIIMSINSSCNSNLNDEDYVAYVNKEEKGLKKTIEVSDWIYDVQYKPQRYILIKEGITNKDNLKKRKRDLENTASFNITIMNKSSKLNPLKINVSNLDEYNQRLNYFLNGVVNDISLKYKGIELKPIGYLYENNYTLTPNETMVVSFELPDDKFPKEDMQLIYNDIIFKNGIIKFNFRKNDILRLADF